MVVNYWGNRHFLRHPGDWVGTDEPAQSLFGENRVHSATVNSRRPASLAPRRASAFLALAAVACLMLGACSPGADYPSLFPSVHDVPPARTDTTLDSNQVQQATEDLISARDRLTAEAQSGHAKRSVSSPIRAAGKSAANSPANSAGKSSAKPATGSAAKQPSSLVSARQTPGTDGEQAAGPETK